MHMLKEVSFPPTAVVRIAKVLLCLMFSSYVEARCCVVQQIQSLPGVECTLMMLMMNDDDD